MSMLREDHFLDEGMQDPIDSAMAPDGRRHWRPFPGAQGRQPSKGKWQEILVLAVLLLTVVNAFPTKLFDESSPNAMRFAPVPKVAVNSPSGLNDRAYRIAVDYFNKYQSRIRNRRYLTVIDYSKPSYLKRLSIIDLQTRHIEKHLVAHGKNSGSCYATDFSNRWNSLKSSKGPFITGKSYYGSHGKSLLLFGLERGLNDHAQRRGIVIHGAKYVNARSIWSNGGMLGRSWGCPAVPFDEIDQIVEKIKNGSLLYIHGTS
jgi:hypothetical protein